MKRILALTTALVIFTSGALTAQQTGRSRARDMQGGMGGCQGMTGHGMAGRGGGCMMGPGAGMAGRACPTSMILGMRRELDLDSDQVQKLKSIRSDMIKSTISRQADIRIARMELAEALSQPDPDFKAARSQAETVSKLTSQNRLARIDAYENALGVLKKEQKEKLQQMMRQSGGMGMGGMSGGADDGEDAE